MSIVQCLEPQVSRAKILDVREQRRMAAPMEFREDTKEGQVVLEGYAATYEPYDCYGGVERGGWIETIDRRAFDKTLRENPDVQLLLNHEGLPLARTTSGTLQLSADSRGLKVRALLDSTDPDVQRILPKMRRGDLNEMSFAFRVKDQRWDDTYNNRLITEVSLQRGDVSVVSYGMNPDTKVVVSRQAIGALAELSDDQLVELRKLDRAELRKAVDVLRRAAGDEFSIPAAGVSRPKRSGNPTANMIASNLVEPNLDNNDTVGEVSGGAVGDGIHDMPAVTNEGSADGPVKKMINPEESPLSMTLVASLESTIIDAYAASTGDARSLLADAVAQIALLRHNSETPKQESEVEKQLRKLQESDPTHPSHKDEMSDEEDKGCEDDPEEEAKSDDDEKPEFLRSEDEDEEEMMPEREEEEEEEEERIGSVSDALRKLHGEAGIPAITNVREGLAYVSTFKRAK
jgi:HK97 family phage prohead protease